MEIKIKRIAKKDTYTIGKLYIDGVYFCDTLEDKDRGLKQTMTDAEIKKLKIKDKTAIPTGKYRLLLNIKSPKFGDRPFYAQTCNGCVPRIDNVPGFAGILIHCGNTDKDSSGCILVGQNKVVGKLINSQQTFTRLMSQYLNPAKKIGVRVNITIE